MHPKNQVEIMSSRFLTALPVFNEVGHVAAVLDEVLRFSPDVLVVDDGSTDGTSEALAARHDVRRVTHDLNRGYGAALRSAFDFTLAHGYDILVTIDCDGQHTPQRIPLFVAAAQHADIVSGSRYLERFDGDSLPPADRRRINLQVTAELNRRLGLNLTDAFCGFKAYRASALEALDIKEPGYAMPLELWVQAAHARLKIVELPVPLIYLEEERSFGGSLDDARKRLQYYHEIIDRSLAAIESARSESDQPHDCCASGVCDDDQS
ncbi:MAG TPA: glycosyltransferase family 2 protein [Pirellulales bacterium]|jgi:glycosyltransferase involved in cell wall biosynthesis|nr:glycosyltransferase family 2 protein [Pirellulales bacterium]